MLIWVQMRPFKNMCSVLESHVDIYYTFTYIQNTPPCFCIVLPVYFFFKLRSNFDTRVSLAIKKR